MSGGLVANWIGVARASGFSDVRGEVPSTRYLQWRNVGDFVGLPLDFDSGVRFDVRLDPFARHVGKAVALDFLEHGPKSVNPLLFVFA